MLDGFDAADKAALYETLGRLRVHLVHQDAEAKESR